MVSMSYHDICMDLVYYHTRGEVARYNTKYPKEILNKDIEMMSIRMLVPEEVISKLTGETFRDK